MENLSIWFIYHESCTGFRLTEVYTGFNRPATTGKNKIRYFFEVPFLKMFPKYGGTLIILAREK